MARTYSSYALDMFQRCPKLWDLSKRWESSEPGFNVYIALGAAVSSGLAALRNKKSKEESERAARATLTERYEDNEEWTFDGVWNHVLTGIDLGMSTNLNLKTILSADKQMYGRSRPDVVGRTPDGKLRIVDDKVKLKLDPRYLVETLDEYKHSNQVFEYAWEVGRYYGEQVASVCINLLIITPKPKGILYPIVLDERHVEYWAGGAEADFDEMFLIESGSGVARTRWTSCTDKWRHECPMHKICHDLHGDETKADTFYERR